MKIVFLSADMCDGGTQRVISVLSKGIALRNHDVYLLIFSKSDKDYLIDKHVKVKIMCESYAEYQRLSGLSRIRYIRKYLRKVKPDIAVAFLQAGYALYLASIKMDFVKVTSLRNSPEKMEKEHDFRATINRLWFRKADSVVLQTEEQRKYASRKGWKNTVVIANPITEKLLDISEHHYAKQCRKIVMVGRLNKQKNYPLAFRAFRIIKEKYPDADLFIYGLGDEKRKLEELADSMQIKNSIHWCGWADDLVTEYSNYDLYLLTSDYEGMPNALMEAMGAGLPCIATDCLSGPAELIIPEKTGFLVPVNDCDKLSEMMVKLMETTEVERKYVGKNARKFILENFNANRISKMWEMHFENIIKRLKGK